jgi:hypothetical protein
LGRLRLCGRCGGWGQGPKPTVGRLWRCPLIGTRKCQRNVAPVGIETMVEEPGPEKYAPPNRRVPEKGSDVERIAFLRQQRSEADPANGSAAENLNAVVQRVASVSLEEIDRVIRALEGVRDMMRKEGERVSREVVGYASLSHAAVTAMQVIADSIKEWRDGPDKSGPRSVS